MLKNKVQMGGAGGIGANSSLGGTSSNQQQDS